MISVRNFGAALDGTADDTAAINKAIAAANAKGGDTVVVDGPAKVRAAYSNADDAPAVIMRSNVTLDFGARGRMTVETNDHPGYQVIQCRDISGFRILRARVFGDKNTHTGKTGEWGHCIDVRGCSDYEVEGECSDAWGDGVYLGRGNVNVTNGNGRVVVRTDNNRRQGVSVITADGLDFFVNSSSTSGTGPAAAVDFEPNRPDEPLRRIRGSIVSKEDQGCGLLFALAALRSTSAPVDIEIEYLSVDGSAMGAQFAYAGAKGSHPRGRITLNKAHVLNTVSNGVYVYNWDSGGPQVTIVEPTLLNCYDGSGSQPWRNRAAVSIVNVRERDESFVAATLGGVTIVGGRFIDNRRAPLTTRAFNVQNELEAANVADVRIVGTREVSGMDGAAPR